MAGVVLAAGAVMLEAAAPAHAHYEDNPPQPGL
jgi:hypothetical protein